jgi:hypothetical protein
MNSAVEADANKRESYLESWQNTAIVQLQQAVANEVREYVQRLKGIAATPEGWRPLPKWSSEVFGLFLEVKIRRIGVKPVGQTSQPAREALSTATSHDDDRGDDSSPDRSPNDDRSDSMNPNNDAYDAAMDNHANQMNPNNGAYWSSRGR